MLENPGMMTLHGMLRADNLFSILLQFTDGYFNDNLQSTIGIINLRNNSHSCLQLQCTCRR